MSASDFIRSQPHDLPVKDVIARGAAVGIHFGRSLIYNVRQSAIGNQGVAPVTTAAPRLEAPAAPAPPPHAPPSSEAKFLRFVVEHGLVRTRALIAEVERATEAVLDELDGAPTTHRAGLTALPLPVTVTAERAPSLPAASPRAPAALQSVPVATAMRPRVALAVSTAAPALASPPLASPALASPPLASPALASPPLASPAPALPVLASLAQVEPAPPGPTVTEPTVDYAAELFSDDAALLQTALPPVPEPLEEAPAARPSAPPPVGFWEPAPAIDPVALRAQIGPAWSREPAARAAVAPDQFDLAPLRAMLDRLGPVPELLTPEVIAVEMQRLYGEVADDGVPAWPQFPKRLQQQLVALVAARARHVQEEPAASVESARLLGVFSILTGYMANARPGYVNGLSRSHVPRGASWLEDARDAWDVLWDELPREKKGEPPNPQVAVGALRALLAAPSAPATDDLVRAISQVLDADVAPDDGRILSLLEPHAAAVTPALGKLGRFKRLRRALRERAEESAQRSMTGVQVRSALQGESPVPPEPAQFDSLLAAVLAAQEAFSSTLTFAKQAISSAKDSPFERPDDAFDALAALSEVASKRFASMADMKSMGSLEKAFKALGFVYKAHESATALGKWSTEYEMLHEGQRVSIEQHIAIGKAGPAHCLRIHFFVDEGGKRIVVGHVGRHKTNTKS